MEYRYARWLLRGCSLLFIVLTIYENALWVMKLYRERLLSSWLLAGLAGGAIFLPLAMLALLLLVRINDPGPNVRGSPLYLAVRPDFVKLMCISGVSIVLSFFPK
jgi:hypothetical protein